MIKLMSPRAVLALGAALAGLASPHGATASAQTSPQAEPTGVEEVVVTATRREENLQDVPISVSVFGAEALRELPVAALNDIMDYAPNVARTSGPSSGQEAYYFIRGVGQQDNSVSLDPGVGVYLDGVYIGRLQGASVDLSDAQRVEVLRGPQGTLFGRNTIGGAVNITSADPTDDFGGKLTLSAGERNLRTAQSVLSIPVTDDLGIRLNAQFRTQDGLGKNRATGATFGDVDTVGSRLKAVWRPNDDLRVDLIGDYNAFEGSPAHLRLVDWEFNNVATGVRFGPGTQAGQVRPGFSALGVPFPGPVGSPASIENDRDPNNRFANFSSTPAVNDSESAGLAAIVSYDWDRTSFKSITSARKFSQSQWTDLDATLYSFYDFLNKTDQEQLSQEFQLSGEAFGERLSWLTGVYLFREDIENFVDICVGSGGVSLVTTPPPPPPAPPVRFAISTPASRLDGRCLSVVNDFKLDIESRAFFAHLTYDLTDKVELVLGGRYTSETKDQSFNNFSDNRDRVGSVLPLAPNGPIALPGTRNPTLSPQNAALAIPTAYSNTWENFSPKIGLNYTLTDDVLLYASYSEGFKSGGFNGRVQSTATSVVPFDEEVVSSVEAGFKSTLFDRMLRLNGSVFQSDYKDIQLLLVIPANGLFETGNGGDAEINGAELEAVFVPTSSLSFNASVGWLDAKYTSINPRAPRETIANGGFGLALKDRLPLTPEWTYVLGARYAMDLGDYGEVVVRADYSYRSEVSYQVFDNLGDRGPGYGLLNLRASYSLPGDRASIALFGTNVLDEEYIRTAQDNRLQLGNYYNSPGAPAEWGVELGVRF